MDCPARPRSRGPRRPIQLRTQQHLRVARRSHPHHQYPSGRPRNHGNQRQGHIQCPGEGARTKFHASSTHHRRASEGDQELLAHHHGSLAARLGKWQSHPLDIARDPCTPAAVPNLTRVQGGGTYRPARGQSSPCPHATQAICLDYREEQELYAVSDRRSPEQRSRGRKPKERCVDPGRLELVHKGSPCLP